MEKIDARSLAPKAQESIRRLAVQTVLEGKKQVEVAKMYSVTRQAVGKWVKANRLASLMH
jgi:transposase